MCSGEAGSPAKSALLLLCGTPWCEDFFLSLFTPNVDTSAAFCMFFFTYEGAVLIVTAQQF